MNLLYKTERCKYALNMLFVLSLSLLFSCKKYLDKRPVENLYVPTTLKDLQALLDNDRGINYFQSPLLLEASADNYYVLATTFESFPEDTRFRYMWQADAISRSGWAQPYQGPIYYSNIVLGVLPSIEIDSANVNQYNSIKGTALFYRAFAFYALAQVYCNLYTTTANVDPGIVLRLTADVEAPVTRATVEQTYQQIIDDLIAAAHLLPDSTVYPTRPCKAAAYGALARTYLSMRDYTNAEKYASLCLQLRSSLLNYNSDLGSYAAQGYPFYEVKNTEIVYISTTYNAPELYQGYAIVDSLLYSSYNEKDLRKDVFFVKFSDGNWHFKGSYHGLYTDAIFDGITTAEMYLIRAETYARLGKVNEAMSDINTLLAKRWKDDGSWVPLTAIDAPDALRQILEERRKELAFRGLRWTDLRRLNEEGAQISLKRKINDVEHILPANDLRWVALIPWEEIRTSNISQNPR